jgi:quercetin dioxygenase-like cupin family protein
MKRRNAIAIGGLAAMSRLFGAAAGKLPDGVVEARNAKLTNEAFGELRVFFDGPTDQLKSMTAGSVRLKPGMEPHPPHQHPEEEFMVVTEGAGVILVSGKNTKVGPGSIMYCAGNKLHGIKNTGSAPLLFYYYKWQK